MKELFIKDYDEFEAITEQQAREFASESGIFKGEYNYYILNITPYYGTSLLIFRSGKRLYEDMQLHHSGSKNIVADLLKRAEHQVFNLAELKTIKNYSDFYNKRHFIYNDLARTCAGISGFWAKTKPESYIFDNQFYYYFANEQDQKFIHELYNNLKQMHFDKLKINLKYFESAVSFEFGNHEVIIGGRFADAYASAGINPKTMTNAQKQICQNVYDKLLKLNAF